MGYALLWTESLAGCLLLVALAAACSARMSRRWLRVAVPVLTALVPGLVGLWAAVLAGLLVLNAQVQMYGWVLWYTAGWVFVFAIGVALIVRGALRQGAGVRWSRGNLLLATVSAIVLSVTTLWNMDLAARTELAAVRAESIGLAASLSASRPPDARNAALVYEQAFGLIGKDAEVPRFSAEGDNTEARAFLKQHAEALALLRKAGAMPDCYFQVALSTESLSALPLTQMRQGARLLLLDARIQAADGHAGAALRDTETAFALARHAGQDPVLIQALVSMAIGQLGHVTLQDVLQTCQPTLADLKEAPVDQTFSYWRLFQRSMELETAFGLASIAEMGERTGGGLLLVHELPGYRSLMQQYNAVLADPYYRAKDGIERLEKEAKGGRWGVIPATLPPAFGRAAVSAAQAQATWELDNMALAATAYRIEHGAFPKDAADLVPQYMTLVPLDPFSGEPLKVHAEEDGGVVLYSIGPDMVDDGGEPFNETSRRGDITFRLQSPAVAPAAAP
jgi:hypothetical protein